MWRSTFLKNWLKKTKLIVLIENKQSSVNTRYSIRKQNQPGKRGKSRLNAINWDSKYGVQMFGYDKKLSKTMKSDYWFWNWKYMFSAKYLTESSYMIPFLLHLLLVNIKAESTSRCWVPGKRKKCKKKKKTSQLLSPTYSQTIEITTQNVNFLMTLQPQIKLSFKITKTRLSKKRIEFRWQSFKCITYSLNNIFKIMFIYIHLMFNCSEGLCDFNHRFSFFFFFEKKSLVVYVKIRITAVTMHTLR